MAKRVGVDKVLFCTTLILVVIGLVMVFSASAIISQGSSGSPYGFLIKQAIWGVLGLAGMTVVMQMDYRKLNHPRIIFPLVAVTALLLLVVFAMPCLAWRAPLDQAGSDVAAALGDGQAGASCSSWRGFCRTNCTW